MDIAAACRTIRAWDDFFAPGVPRSNVPGGLPEAVLVLKRYLERARPEAGAVRELHIAERLLMTPEAIRWVMPFVREAEALQLPHREKTWS